MDQLMVNGLILFAHIEGYSMFTVLLNSCNPKVNYRIMKKMCWLYLFAIIALVFYGCLTLRYEFLFVWPICVLMPIACDYLSAVHMKNETDPKIITQAAHRGFLLFVLYVLGLSLYLVFFFSKFSPSKFIGTLIVDLIMIYGDYRRLILPLKRSSKI